MSQPKRFICTRVLGMFEAHFSENGEYVLYTDYAALASEKEVETRATFDAIRTITQLRDDYAALAAENERLRRDANELADNLEKAAGNTASHYNCLIKWRASKGVQS